MKVETKIDSKITIKMFEEAIPDKINLIYVDYRDSLDEHTDILNEVVRSGNFNNIYENIWDWYSEAEHDGINCVMDEAINDIANNLDCDEDIVREFIEENEDELRDLIYNRQDDDTVGDLLRNTNKQIMFYDTGHYVSEGSWDWNEKEIKQELKEIKKAVKIKLNNTDYDDDLSMMIRQASYGGSLVIHFRVDIEDVICKELKHDDFNSITFDDFTIAIIDTCNGSGDNTELPNHSITLEFDRNNLFLEKSIKYNYSYSVCGMCEDWCDNTVVDLSTLKRGKKIQLNNSIANEVNRNTEANKIYKDGKCTIGDMDISRHRNTTYTNNYPCGTKCKDCGTFWID